SLQSLGRRVSEEAPLRDLLLAVAADSDAADAADAVQAALEGTIPNRLLAERFVARSSAVGEDGSAHSFAGIYESFPGLRWEEMGAGVVLCWASAFAGRAEDYRTRAGVSAAEAPLAVIVQPLVAAVSSGVA